MPLSENYKPTTGNAEVPSVNPAVLRGVRLMGVGGEGIPEREQELQAPRPPPRSAAEAARVDPPCGAPEIRTVVYTLKCLNTLKENSS